jgi:hypothetical protein
MARTTTLRSPKSWLATTSHAGFGRTGGFSRTGQLAKPLASMQQPHKKSSGIAAAASPIDRWV